MDITVQFDGIDFADMGFTTIKDVFAKYRANEQPTAEEVIIKHPIRGLNTLDVIPSSILLFNVEEDITIIEGRTKILKSFLNRNKKTLEKYDYIFMDTNPSMSVGSPPHSRRLFFFKRSLSVLYRLTSACAETIHNRFASCNFDVAHLRMCGDYHISLAPRFSR